MQTMRMDAQYIAPTYARFGVTFVRGEGSCLFDDKDNRYIDLGSGIAVNVLGYGDKQWTQAVADQAAQLAHASNLYYTQPQAKLAKLLCQKSGMKRAFFCNSGAEANECALKVARKYASDNGRWPTVVTLTGSFHGRTIATLAATGQDAFHHDFGPFPEGFAYAKPNDVGDLERVMNQYSPCAVLLETIQGEGGIIELTDEYVKAVRELTQARGTLMMVDEVQTGNGRTGKLFSYQHFGLLPDVATTAKGLAGGLPMGVCLLGEKVKDVLTPGSHGSTFGGNPVCAAAALSVQSRLTDALLGKVSEKGAYIRAELEPLAHVKSVSGRGLMLGVETDRNARELCETLLKKGVVTLTAKNRLRLLPPLTISHKDLKKAIEIIKEELA